MEKYMQERAIFDRYDLTKATYDALDKFYESLERYDNDPTIDNKGYMKFDFLQAHCALKCDHASHRISHQQLDELTEIMRNGA